MAYGSLFLIEDFLSAGTARRLERVALSGSKASSGYDEKWLQRLIASHPQALPIAEVESFLEGAVPICLELGTNAGPIDLVLVTPHGDIVLVECKLWRNPQARREVVGQIIDYAKELPRLSYDAFDAAIRKADPAGGVAKTDSLYQRAGAEAAGVDEATFVDAISRNLRRGRFLLLIVGDGIQEGVQSIVEFLQQHAGMHFTLAMVEVAIFKTHRDGFLVQPRVLAKTQMVPRGVVSIEDDRVTISSDKSAESIAQSVGRRDASRPSIPATISEARLYEELEAKLPGGTARLHQLIVELEAQGASPRFTSTTIVLQAVVADRALSLARLDVGTATAWFEDVVAQAEALGRRDAGLDYYRSLASLVRDPTVRAKKLNPATKTGTASLPLDDLLSQQEAWLAAVTAYLRVLADATNS